MHKKIQDVHVNNAVPVHICFVEGKDRLWRGIGSFAAGAKFSPFVQDMLAQKQEK